MWCQDSGWGVPWGGCLGVAVLDVCPQTGAISWSWVCGCWQTAPVARGQWEGPWEPQWGHLVGSRGLGREKGWAGGLEGSMWWGICAHLLPDSGNSASPSAASPCGVPGTVRGWLLTRDSGPSGGQQSSTRHPPFPAHFTPSFVGSVSRKEGAVLGWELRWQGPSPGAGCAA